jgi:two-component system, OmpR family, KDP operon response regulator KdpE
MAGPELLLVEDDRDLATSVAAALVSHGYRVRPVGSANEGLAAWEARRPDLVLLDLGLPDLDGTAVIRRIRREATTPILVLSARHLEGDRIEALEGGADDYLTKPFGIGELVARVRALLRRAAGPSADVEGRIEIGSLVVDVPNRSVTVAGREVDLTPREFEVLKVLVAHAGRLVTHGRLLRAVWGTGYSDESHYTHVYVSQIRRKLAAADPDGQTRALIVAEPGVGYRVREARV